MLDTECSCRFQNGVAITELMDNLLTEDAKPTAMDECMAGLLLSNSPAARLNNWNLLRPLLKEHFGYSITADQKALIVGGGAPIVPLSSINRAFNFI